MSSIAIVITILVVATAILCGIGMILTKKGRLNRATGSRYTKICALLLSFMGYWLCSWGLQLKTFDSVSATLALSLITYSAIFAASAYQLSKLAHEVKFEESYMLSHLEDDESYFKAKNN